MCEIYKYAELTIGDRLFPLAKNYNVRQTGNALSKLQLR